MSSSTIRANKACFEGLVLQALAYGALVMLYIQITQVLVRRPKRNRMFWLITFYSTALFPLATFAFIGKLIFMEKMYVGSPGEIIDSKAYYGVHCGEWANVISQVCITMIPWIGDLLMLYRLMVVWNYKWVLLIVPGGLYITRFGMAFPHLLTMIRTNPDKDLYGFIFYGLCVGLNTMVTIMICVRLFMMRHKAEMVLGNLQASLYNSCISIFVESGAFFSLWSLVYLSLRAKNSWAQDIFFQPYSFILALTRMLIILRMAQDRAWTREIITAADNGILDWEVSSVNSLPTNVSKPTDEMTQKLPNKFREDSLSSRSTISP
ncbi:hypothetical protein JR316_0011458 [Psilocybe cubensis]|uniref:Uncharacterized protein n=2 Tax=Psilocybe cubensis TaxID=181762 RepID=A0A8H8CIX1_PSICU|nr:hypothetical protein JR316_0011458 [Psilocybe cubensis]KAH9475897.1 hypothetical protein JR316_0011458 [Psilocybe cubensis]